MGLWKWLTQKIGSIGKKQGRFRNATRRAGRRSQRSCATCGYFDRDRCRLYGFVFSPRQLKRGAHRRRKCEDYEWNIWAE